MRLTVILAALVSAVAFALQAWRYGLIVSEASAPVNGTANAVNELLLVMFGSIAVVVSVLALVIFVLWLQDARAVAFAAEGHRDPRPWWQAWLAFFLPPVNLVWPLAFVREWTDAAERPGRWDRVLVYGWYAAWVVALLLAWSSAITQIVADSRQWQANAVFLAMLDFLAVAIVAVLTLWVMHRMTSAVRAAAPQHRWVLAG